MIELAGAAAELGGARWAVRRLGVYSVGEHPAAGRGASLARLAEPFVGQSNILLGVVLEVLPRCGQAGTATARPAETIQELKPKSFVSLAALSLDHLDGHVDARLGRTEEAPTLEQSKGPAMIDGAIGTDVVTNAESVASTAHPRLTQPRAVAPARNVTDDAPIELLP